VYGCECHRGQENTNDQRQAVRSTEHSWRVRPTSPLIYGGALAAGLLAKTLFPIDFLPRRVMGLLGLPLLSIGLLPFLSSLRSLRLARTDARPHKPTSSLDIEDPYHFTRNPIYLGFTFCSDGITALANSPRPPCCSPSSSSSCSAG
jgi:protein-S-isoprenylcysteine O-methyltransferase Ste14